MKNGIENHDTELKINFAVQLVEKKHHREFD